MRMAILAAVLVASSPEWEVRGIEGWTVKVHRDVADPEAVRLLETRLRDIVRLVPAAAVAKLRKVPIWIGTIGIAQYHPDRGWLEKNGYDPEKAKAVDLGSAKDFIRETKRQPFMVLHELAH